MTGPCRYLCWNPDSEGEEDGSCFFYFSDDCADVAAEEYAELGYVSVEEQVRRVCVRCQDGSVKTFSISVDYSPNFYANEEEVDNSEG